MSSDLLFEDDTLRVINKLPGVVVEEKMNDFFPAHRLDKDTSGVLVLARNEEALEVLRAEFKERRVKKEYVALVYGVPKEKSGRINQPLKRSPRYPLRRTVHPEGKPAITEWKVIETFGPSTSSGSTSGRYSLLRLRPITGRTHQLRAHLHWLGHPIVGDKLYNFRSQEELPGVPRQMLHAHSLTLRLAQGEKQTFRAPVPEDFKKAIDDLRAN